MLDLLKSVNGSDILVLLLSIRIKHIIVYKIIVCDEWTELNCSGEAAPEELEEHSMVAHEVQMHQNQLLLFFCVRSMSVASVC